MVDTNPFAGIKLDRWYKVLIPFGGILAIIALFYSPTFITQKELFVLGCGLFLLGIGEWKNNKIMTRYVSATYEHNAHYLYIPVWKPDFIGILMDILGVLAVIISLLSFFDVISLD